MKAYSGGKPHSGEIPMAPKSFIEVRKFKMAWWKKWPLFLLGLIAMETLLVFPEVAGIIMSERTEEGITAFGLVAGFLVILTILLMLLVGEVMFSYLEVSPKGIEYRLWPFYHLEFDWDEIESIQRARILKIIPVDSMNVAITNRSSFATTTVLKQSISISDFQGWPRGKLAEALRENAPQLFDNSTTPRSDTL
jgi:hypothetical protein